MLIITSGIIIPEAELNFSAIRSQGPGGQNVNKVSSAIHLRFNIRRSSLPQRYQQKLLDYSDQRITKDGVVIIKAQRYRTQEKNRIEALSRLKQLVLSATRTSKPRLATRPTRSSQVRRMDKKALQAKKKTWRATPRMD